MSTPHTQRCFVRFQETGDPSALAQVFDLAAPVLMRIARRMTRDAERAADAVQQTFLIAIERRATFDGRRPVEPWLFGILVREVAAQRRRDARAIDPNRMSPTVLREDDPREIAAREELVRELVDALARLPQRDREVLEPWMRGERPQNATSDSAPHDSTLRMRIHRAIERLRRSLPLARFALVPLRQEEHAALAIVRGRVLTAVPAPATLHATASKTASVVIRSVSTRVVVSAAALLVGVGTWTWVAGKTSETPVRTAAERGAPRERPIARAAADASASERNLVRGDPVEAGGGIEVSRGDVAAYAIDGVVLDDANVPVAGARIRLFADGPVRRGPLADLTSDSNGHFRYETSATGSVAIVAEHPEFARVTTRGSPFGSPTEVRMSRGKPLQGRVELHDGRPAPFARVELADECSRFVGLIEVRCDDRGEFALSHSPPRNRFARVTSDDGREHGVVHSSSWPTPFVLRLTLPSELRVRVVDSMTKQPIFGAEVAALSRAAEDEAVRTEDLARVADLSAIAAYGRRARTDQQGTALFTEIASGRLDVLAVAANRAVRGARVEITPGTNEAAIELSPDCAVSGRVVELSGAPVANAIVFLDPDAFTSSHHTLDERDLEEVPVALLADGAPNPFAISARTQSDGSFVLAGLSVGANVLTVRDRNRTAHAEIALTQPGARVDGIVVRMGAQIEFDVVLRAEDGAAFDGKERVWIHPSRSGRRVATGRFHFSCEPRSKIVLWATANGYVHRSLEVDAKSVLSEVEIVLERGATIRGWVRSPEGTPIGGAMVLAWPADPTEEERSPRGGWITELSLATAISAADGTFEIQGLGPRSVKLVARAKGVGEGSLASVIPGAKDVELSIPSH